MRSNTASTKGNEQHKLTRLSFIGFLVVSPLLPYLITMAYHSILFGRTTAQIQSLPSYPGAKLVEEYIVQDYSSNRCQVWVLRYETTATTEQIGKFYKSALLKAGWLRTGGAIGFERYQNYTMNVLVDYEDAIDKRKITVSVTADVIPLFDLGC